MIATIRTGSVIIALLLFTALAAAAEIPYLPHHAANTCRQQYNDECTTVCLLCHQSPTEVPSPALPDTQGQGDMAICGQCHDDHVVVYEGNRYMFKHLGPGNHPTNVRYDESKPGYIADPQGVKIFCAADRTQCSVQCSSCHDSHETARNLLRVNNAGSHLCLSCHRK